MISMAVKHDFNICMWTFELYDLDGDGLISKQEMEDLTLSVSSSEDLYRPTPPSNPQINELMGGDTSKLVDGETLNPEIAEMVDRAFRV